ncbi:MAG: chemotaxis protein CheD, partial [Pseudomonadota bacterium]
VSVCLWDPERNLGGMNHMLLPDRRSDAQQTLGSADMEKLINALLRRGAKRERLQAKLFGGAAMLEGKTAIGRINAEFALEYLEREGIPCLAKSTGGNQARQVRFFPHTGKVKHRYVAENPDPPKARAVELNDVELF